MMNFCKPSGTVSQLVDSASGIHPRFDQYYIRRVRADAKDPLCGVLEAAARGGKGPRDHEKNNPRS